MKDIIYERNNRCLGPMKKEHLPFLKQWRNEQMDILRQQQPLTDRDQEEWFQKIQSDLSQVIFSLMISDEQNAHKFIGYCGITNIDQVNRRGEISFIVEPARAKNEKLYREDLLSTFYMLGCHGFKNLNLHKLYTETYVFRKCHIQLLEEFGLRRGGILRDHKFVKGRYWDSIIHSMLETEWAQAKERIENVLGK